MKETLSSVTNKCIVTPPTFSMITNSVAMEELKWLKQLDTRIFAVDV